MFGLTFFGRFAADLICFTPKSVRLNSYFDSCDAWCSAKVGVRLKSTETCFQNGQVFGLSEPTESSLQQSREIYNKNNYMDGLNRYMARIYEKVIITLGFQSTIFI
mgnify:CR=1 FL=1